MIRNMNGLNPLHEGAQAMDIIEMLTQSAVADSATVLIRCAALLGKELTKAMVTQDSRTRLAILEKTLADTRALRTAASKIPDDGLTDYVWAAIGSWWKLALKYGVGAAKNPEGISSTTRNSTLAKFDMLIKFLKVEIAKTKLEIAQDRT